MKDFRGDLLGAIFFGLNEISLNDIYVFFALLSVILSITFKIIDRWNKKKERASFSRNRKTE